jgi:hypothetical protein
MTTVYIRRHEVMPKCRSFEVRYSDGRAGVYFYWDDLPNRRLRQIWSRRSSLEAGQSLLLELSGIG